MLRYAFLALSLLPALGGGMLALSLLDPFSIFARAMTSLGLPVAGLAKNTAVRILESAGSYALYPARIPPPAWPALIVALVSIGVVGVLAWKRGRLFCNTVCPVGTLLGLVSRGAAFRVTVDAAHCTACGLCERVCKAGCIDPEGKRVDMSRCVGCCNCLTVCATDAIRYTPSWRRHRPAPKVDAGRRDTMLGGLAFLLGSSGVSGSRIIPAPVKPATVPVLRRHPVTPPGAQSIDRFTSTCTACHLCVGACPARVLAPAFLEYGVSGMLQPRMDFAASYCTYECTRCTDVCPTGALFPLPLVEKKLTQLGTAKFIKENCIVFTEEKECGACSEHCPTKAVKMVPYKKKLVIPEVTAETCIGCGACEHACPTVPWRAIFVEGNPVHKRARAPEKATPREQAVPAEFPF
jgi:ferredoxin